MNFGRSLCYHLSRLVLAGVFLYAGAIKATDVVAFAGQIANYQLLPYAWNFLVAATLPYVEILSGVLLLINRRIKPALLILLLLNGVFIVALVSVMVRGFDIDCGCFNPDSESVTPPIVAIVRDIGFIVLISLIWWLKPGAADKGGVNGR